MNTVQRLQRLDNALSNTTEFASDHPYRRAILGLPISAAISAPMGKKLDAFAEGYGHTLKKEIGGLGKGAAIGAGVGALASGAMLASLKAKNSLGSLARAGFKAAGSSRGRFAGRAVLGGSLLGAAGGSIVGGLKAHLGKDAAKINEKYDKMRR